MEHMRLPMRRTPLEPIERPLRTSAAAGCSSFRRAARHSSRRQGFTVVELLVVICIVDSKGRVQNPKVQSSSNPALEAAAMRSVKKWRYQPGTRKGQPVATRARVVIDFPKQ